MILFTGYNIPDFEATGFNESWNKSANNLKQMLQYVIGTKDRSGLRPHQVRDSHSVLEARRVLAILLEPLAKITCNIESNTKLIKEHKESIVKIDNDMDELRSKILIPITEIETKELEIPQLICVSAKCATYDAYGKVIVNKTCHDSCCEIDIPVMYIGDRRVKNCHQFKWWTFYRKCY